MSKEKDSQNNPPEEKNIDIPKTSATPTTYYCYKDNEGGSIEVDLVLLREKGEVIKYLSFDFFGINLRTDPPTPQIAHAAIETKEDFIQFQNFIAQLRWE